MSNNLSRGTEQIASTRDFGGTVKHLESVLAAKGLTIFAKIDFSGDAERAGLKMPRTQALIFGNPKGGTPVMVAAPSSALDLPLKIVVSEDASGKTWLSYNSPEYLAERHGIPAELLKNIVGIRALASAAAT
ncbi:MAG TPA: DUF302 domain-containing protein [Candidatus Acidoferrales bacterium]|nr:DUF302 domain-containing protein [Candidatus Acidoferrales bacterium]